MQNIYEQITNEIVKQLEAGKIPWHKPWKGGGFPANFASKKEYRGMNAFWLAMLADAKGYTSPYWLTFLQAKNKGGHVKSGEKGTQVVFWKFFTSEKEDKDGLESEERRIPMLRTYTVFNVEQCEGLKLLTESVQAAAPISPIEACEKIVSGYPKPPFIEHGEARAYYRPSADTINMPKKELFETAEEYYSTLFHELGHSTGHERRLNRKAFAADSVASHRFGDTAYSKEELVAEMTDAFLCGVAGISQATIENSAAYIRGWLKALKADKKMLIMAAAQAQKAADHILDRKHEAVAAVETPERPKEAVATKAVKKVKASSAVVFRGNPDGNKSYYKPVAGWSDYQPSKAVKEYQPNAHISYGSKAV